MPPVKAPAKADPKFAFKKVRATQPMWDGFLLRNEDDEFALRVCTHVPAYDEKGRLKREKDGSIAYLEVEPSRAYEILGDANAVEVAQLSALWADPILAVPETQRPPDEKAKPQTQALPTVPITGVLQSVASDGGVL